MCIRDSVYSTSEIIMASETVFIIEFDVKCDGSLGTDLYLHSDVQGHHIPVTNIPGTNKYQISWSMEHSVAVAGDYLIHIYDEEGFAALRKAQRSGESLDSVKPLLSTTIAHPGAKRLGFFLQTEFMAVLAAFLIWWYANTMKGRISE